MLLTKFMIHLSRGRSSMGRKARAKPKSPARGPRVHFKGKIMLEEKMIQARMMPKASSENCFRVMSPTK